MMGPKWAAGMRSDRLVETMVNEGYNPHRPNLQSMLEMNDLAALLHDADLAGKKFEAERNSELSFVATAGTAKTLNPEELLVQQRKMDLHAEDLRIPRRPLWDKVLFILTRTLTRTLKGTPHRDPKANTRIN